MKIKFVYLYRKLATLLPGPQCPHLQSGANHRLPHGVVARCNEGRFYEAIKYTMCAWHTALVFFFLPSFPLPAHKSFNLGLSFLS
jgi:hypothetical protein